MTAAASPPPGAPDARADGALLEVERLAVRFATAYGAVDAVRDARLDVRRGEIVALVGESGSGKSVTAMTLLGLTRGPRTTIAGSARFDGTELLSASDAQLRAIRGRRAAMVFQDPMRSLNPVMRIGDQIAEQLRAHQPVGRAAARRQAVELLGQVGIAHPHERAGAFPHEFSGGMRQRAMIAMALSCDPELLIADEPTTALDVTVQAQILALIVRCCREREMAVLLVTHDLGVVAETADRVVVMHDGQTVERATCEELFATPQHSHTAALLAASPSLLRPRAPRPQPRSERHDHGPLLTLTHLRQQFEGGSGTLRAVDDVSLTVARGETLALVGESGCGKSTLVRTALRLLEPSGGTITFDGTPLTGRRQRALRPLRHRLQMVFQDPYGSLNPRRRVGAVLAEAFAARGVPRAERGNQVAAALRRVGLEPEHAGRWPHELSGGQLQRVAVARALAAEPELLVADEPLSALDASVQAQLVELLMTLQRQLGLAQLFVAHDLAVVRELADRVAVMYLGRIVEHGPAETIFRRPRHPYTRALIAAAPIPDPQLRDRPRELLRGELPSPLHPPDGCALHPRCPRATERCASEQPALWRYADQVAVACHHPHGASADDCASAVRDAASPVAAGRTPPRLR
ncbi:MAG: ABC transporter ATP-binding protein [Patulibacter sp.]